MQCFAEYPFNLNAITTPGFYKLAGNVAGQITIAASNTTLDMNGHTVRNGQRGIIINSGLNNIRTYPKIHKYLKV